MKGVVIYDSSYGNTKAIAEAIAEGLTEAGVSADMFYVKDVKKLKAADYDVMVIGSPTKMGTMSFSISRFLGKVKEKDWHGKPFAAFDTENPENLENSLKENKNWSAAEKIAEKLREKNMKQLRPVLKSLVNDWKGPLLEGEADKARGYGAGLAVKINAGVN